jgi:Leucine-rich repeat (LRR) protein
MYYAILICCHSNEIAALPKSPLELEDLRVLDLSHNYISVLPENFLTCCSKLEILCAANNQLGKK